MLLFFKKEAFSFVSVSLEHLMPPCILIVDDSKLARIVAGRKIQALQPDWERVEAADIRALRPDMPIAVITANVQDEVIARARAVNATFVTKPVTEEALSGFVAGAALRLSQA